MAETVKVLRSPVVRSGAQAEVLERGEHTVLLSVAAADYSGPLHGDSVKVRVYESDIETVG